MPPRQLHPDSLALTLLLTLLVSFGPLTVDLYVPSMPEVAQVMQTRSGDIQFTISLYLMGFAAGQVVCGPISDRYGRKPAFWARSYFIVWVRCCASRRIVSKR